MIFFIERGCPCLNKAGTTSLWLADIYVICLLAIMIIIIIMVCCTMTDIKYLYCHTASPLTQHVCQLDGQEISEVARNL